MSRIFATIVLFACTPITDAARTNLHDQDLNLGAEGAEGAETEVVEAELDLDEEGVPGCCRKNCCAMKPMKQPTCMAKNICNAQPGMVGGGGMMPGMVNPGMVQPGFRPGMTPPGMANMMPGMVQPGWTHGMSPWSPPTHMCNMQTVTQVATCVFNTAQRSGGLQQFFFQVAGPDQRVSYSEWQARVGSTYGSGLMFTTLATQEGGSASHKDDPNTIDQNDWNSFMRQQEKAAPGRTNANEFGQYVATRVTAERLFKLANDIGLSQFMPYLGDKKLASHEWLAAWYKLKPQQDGVGVRQFAQSLGMQDPGDCYKVFQFINDAAGNMCPSWNGAQDAKKIQQCEWIQFGNKMQQWSQGYWANGLEEGRFVKIVSKQASSYYGFNSGHTFTPWH